MKRLLSLLLAICMIASFFVGVTPQMAQAAGPGVEITDPTETRGRFFYLDTFFDM